MASMRLFCLLAAALAGLMAAGPSQAAETYATNLGPMPLDAANKANLIGRGDAIATFDGKVLTVNGSFGGLSSPATTAHLIVGLYIGVPGTQSFDLSVTPAVSGTVSGQVPLGGKLASAFRTGKLYVQIDSQKAPTGNLWGWLLPQHQDAPPDVPQSGPWFLPQLDTPSH